MADLQDLDLEKREVADGVVLFKRKRSTLWQARIRRTTGKWITVSTKTSDFEAARNFGVDRKRQMEIAQRTGQIDVTRSFKDVATLTIKQLQDQLDAGVGKSVYRDYIQAIKRYLIPCFGNKPIHTINHTEVLRLDRYRLEKLKRQPNRSTITTHNAALNKVFATAIERGFMLSIQLPTLLNHGRATRARPYFNRDEYTKLSQSLRHFASTGHKGLTREIRELLWDYVLILANTGMRTGVEALGLKWNNIKRITLQGKRGKDGQREQALKFAVVGKKKPRELICRDALDNVTRPLGRIQKRFKALKDLSEAELFKTDEYVFRLPSTNKVPSHFRLMKAFRILLTSLDLYKDLGGRSRSLYSLRHTYATNAILNGVDFETLSVQMGTSVGMLEKHYSHLKPEMRAGTLSGLDARRRKEAKKDENEAVQTLALQMAKLAEDNAKLRAQMEQLSKE